MTVLRENALSFFVMQLHVSLSDAHCLSYLAQKVRHLLEVICFDVVGLIMVLRRWC